MFTQGVDAPVASLETWGEQHGQVWASLTRQGRLVRVVVVGRDPVHLAGAERVLARWSAGAESAGRVAAELAAVRRAVGTLDRAVLESCGGLNGALDRIAELEGMVGGGQGPAIAAGGVWRSERVPE